MGECERCAIRRCSLSAHRSSQAPGHSPCWLSVVPPTPVCATPGPHRAPLSKLQPPALCAAVCMLHNYTAQCTCVNSVRGLLIHRIRTPWIHLDTRVCRYSAWVLPTHAPRHSARWWLAVRRPAPFCTATDCCTTIAAAGLSCPAVMAPQVNDPNGPLFHRGRYHL